MKNYKGISRALVIALMASMFAAGCSKDTDVQSETLAQTETAPVQTSDVQTEAPQTEIETQNNETLAQGQMRSFLTGEVIDSSVGMKRPVALMINNIEEATPQQCGTSQADILYEAVVEGGITRMMAIFQDTEKIEKIGSVRSARHNYIDFANNFDAIYCHYGQSVYATDRIAQDGIKTVSENVGSAYFQDHNYSAPHHIFASGETLEAGIAQIGARRELPEGYEGSLLFHLEDTEPEYGTIANHVSIPFKYSSPTLTYDSETKLYMKTQYGKPHLDANDSSQLKFKNIIVQYAYYEDIVGGSGCQDIMLNGEGKALYITDGKAINVTWKRADKNAQTKYYTEDGTQVKMNPGKTYIAVVPENFDVTLSE